LSNCSNIDLVFLDNTYCAPECVFPSREEAADQIIALIQANRDHRIIIGMRQLGKEDLLVKIALKFQEWISVPLAMYRTAEILGLQDVFCVDDMDCQIRIVPFH
jgi:DNA cross-link repair 1B protein